MKFGGKTPGPGVLNGFLDRGCTLTGELKFEDTLRLDGTFRGKITSQHELIIGDSGDFDGEIDVGRVSINGRVAGIVRASQRIEIHPGGRVSADLIAPILVVEEGAILEGRVLMGSTAHPEALPQRSAEARPASERKLVAMAGAKRRDEDGRD
jgi:cytoskeletal protein CcmA (bactofilin family)